MGTAESLREAMESRGLSVAVVAGTAGISERTLYRMRKQAGYGTLESWLAVSDAIGCGLDELTGAGGWTNR